MALEAHDLNGSYPSLRIVLSGFSGDERHSIATLLAEAGHTVAEPPASDAEVDCDVWLEQVSPNARRSEIAALVDRLDGSRLILVSGSPSVEIALLARDCRTDYVPAARRTGRLLSALRPTQQGLRRKNALSAHEGGDFPGSDPRLRRIAKLIDSLADSRRPVIVSGEIGTGKTAVVQAICARLGEQATVETIDFTSAPSAEDDLDRAACSVRAGVLVLEELSAVTESASEATAALLRKALESRVSPRLLITTTEGDRELPEPLARLLRAHVSLRLPALRERPADLPTLVGNFVDRLRAVMRVPCCNERLLTASGWLELCGRPFYGNLAELEICLTRALDNVSGEPIGPSRLPPPLPRCATAKELRELIAVRRAAQRDTSGASEVFPVRSFWRRPMST